MRSWGAAYETKKPEGGSLRVSGVTGYPFTQARPVVRLTEVGSPRLGPRSPPLSPPGPKTPPLA